MKYTFKALSAGPWRAFVGALTLICAASVAAWAQTPYTPGGTVIPNTATSTYSDGVESYATTSNTVSVTVSNIAGLVITPDAGTRANVVLGQTGVDFNFTVTNTGNFTNQVVFKDAGASIIKTGTAPSTITAAVIDVNKDGLIDGGDTDILVDGASDVTSADVLQDGTLFVIVRVSVDAGATPGQTINIQLGDAGGSSPYDNVPVLLANFSANEVRTAIAGSNGYEEARGNVSTEVESDALIRLSLTRTPGPVAIGADITYDWILANDGARAAGPQTLTVDSSPVTGIFIIAPIPARTVLKSGQTFPAGTIYTTSAITTAPLSASWSATAPGDLNTLTRIGFNTGNSLAPAASTSTITMLVTVKSGISVATPIREIGDAFAKNSLPTPAAITDQSHDAVANAGDGNADFTQGDAIGSVDGDGVMLNTTLSSVGSVLLGPSGFAGAVGPTNTDDDYTNRTVNTGIATVGPGGNTTAQGVVTFTNTVENTGNADDTYTFTATVPSGFTVEVSVNGLGTDYVNVNTSPTLAVPYDTSSNILVRVTAPAGNLVLTAFPTTVLATSLNTPAATNATINRLYTGYLQLTKSQTVVNGTSRGAADEAVPGATIAYVVAYDNVTSSGGTNNAILTASSIVLSDPVPANTDFKVGSATSNPSAGITVVVAYSSEVSGSDFTYTPVDGAGGAPAGYDRLVKRVRFTLSGPLAPDALAGNNGFTVRIR